MSSATCDMGVRSWLKRVRETKAIWGVRMLLESMKMKVAKEDRATWKNN